MISPKMRIKKVRIPVAIPAPTLPRSLIAMEVAREEAERFTILFPIKIVLKSLPGLSMSFNTVSALLSPSSLKALILCRFTVVNAVSAEEKKAERQSSNSKNIN